MIKAAPPKNSYEIVATIRALSLIGGPEALEWIAQFATDSSNVLDEIFRAWSYFQAEDFADKVLVRRRLRGRPVKVSDLGVVDSLRRLKNIKAVELDLPGEEIDSLWRLEEVPNVTSLKIVGGNTLQNLDGLQQHPGLRQITLAGCSGVRDFSTLNGMVNLEEVSIKNPGHAVAIDTSAMSSLNRMTISSPSAASVGQMLLGAELRYLHVANGTNESIQAFGISNTLQELKIEQFSRLSSLRGLQDFASLEAVTIARCAQVIDLEPIAQNGHIDTMRLWSNPSTIFSSLKNSRCKELEIRYSYIPDLDWLKDLVNLKRLRFIGCQIGSLKPASSLILETLDLRNTTQIDRDGFIDMAGVYFDTRCEVIVRLGSPVENLPSRIKVRIG